jgi:hypothetical protein
MARKFVTQREIDLIDRLNRELIQGTSQQFLIYYAVSYDESVVHDVYEESIRKEYHTPVRVACRAEFQQLATKTGGGHLHSQYQLEARIHADELRDRNLRCREGDFVEYGQMVYEISSVVTDQPVYGQINNKLEVVLTCVPSREGNFKADNVTADGVDNTHPVETARPRTLGDDL